MEGESSEEERKEVIIHLSEGKHSSFLSKLRLLLNIILLVGLWKKLFSIRRLREERSLLPLFFFIFCIGINIYFRLFPAYFPQLKKEAEKKVEQLMRDNSSKAVEELYPHLNSLSEEVVIDETVRMMKKDRKKVREQVDKVYKSLKDNFQNEKGRTYLLELDPYHWMRYVKNILNHGYPGDERRGNKSYDTYMLAPIGNEIGKVKFPFYLASFLYKGFTFFFKGMDVESFLFYLPIFYTFLFLSCLYFFCKHFFSDLAGFFTVLFVGLNGLLLQKSCAGWFDYDVFTLFFPLIIVWLIISSLKNKDKLSKLIFYSLSASFFLGVFAYSWVGWWFIFFIIGISFLFGIVNAYLINYSDKEKAKKEIVGYLLSGGIFLIGSILFCGVIAHINLVKDIFASLQYHKWLGSSLSASIWPNTYYTVGELQKVTPEAMVKYLYGRVVFILSLGGMLWIYLKKRREEPDFLNIMFFWVMLMVFVTLKGGVRFIVFVSLPLGIFLGGFVEEISQIVKKEFIEKGQRGMVGFIIFLGFLFWITNLFFKSGYSAASSSYPLMNDSWAKAMRFIRENTPKEAIINSWWDYGNIFEAVGERRVIFDGQSQNTPLAYWMGRVLVNPNEEEAIRILRMMNNASYKTFTFLNQYIKDPFRCYVVLEKLLKLNKEEAKEVLRKEKLPASGIEKVLADLFKKPAPAYFIVEGSMISKMPHIAFLGKWDIKKLYVKKHLSQSKEKVLKGLQEIFGLSSEESNAIYQETVLALSSKKANEALSKRLRFHPPLVKGRKEKNIVYFDGNGLIYNLDTYEAIFYWPPARGYKIPRYVCVFEDGKLKRVNFENSNAEISVLVIKDKDSYSSIFLNGELAGSLFTRLFFFRGKEVKFFEPVYSDDNAKIYVYRIKWEAINEGRI